MIKTPQREMVPDPSELVISLNWNEIAFNNAENPYEFSYKIYCYIY